MEYVNLANLVYIAASVLFILGLKGLAHPRTAVRGNLLGALGMFLAVVVTLLDRQIISYELIFAGLVVGSAVGALLATRIQMTAMPQMVALLNGFGGGASVLVAGAALVEMLLLGRLLDAQFTIATAASGLIGGVTFWGSLVAFGKLQGVVNEQAVVFSGQHLINLVLALVAVGLGVWLVLEPQTALAYWILVAVASVLGVLLTIPIGGADMPVVIALLNSYSGLAACATGFVLNNNVLIIAGSLVGASGIILTQIMSKAMNRSLANILFGGVGAAPTAASKSQADEIYAGRVKSASADEIAMILDAARRVAIVPGYGMAVSQAQYAVRDLTNLLEQRGVEVLFGIHPVAGRMPGHMNVLLAEANIAYDKLLEMDQINPLMDQVDVAIVIGANDVVNPVARTDPSSPIAGMPIIDVDKSRTVVVIKRSLSPGFAGIPNPLFAADNTLMFFADGKQAVTDLIAAVKAG
ncbi:MAG: NAD(P)(+) transhydrogenase (Re/Si-specific) subunit beta [Candidatus Zixiibacteriota bacterium]|nr:MAG: NAD(P)(+) transhydrogenase (Re/Si-specific) subunit beta [candidate division Zixibacteria bacterium]